MSLLSLLLGEPRRDSAALPIVTMSQASLTPAAPVRHAARDGNPSKIMLL